MLGDGQYRIDGQLIRSAAECFRNRRVYAKAKLLGVRFAQVPFGLLMNMKRDHGHIGFAPFTRVRITDQEAVAHVLAV